MTLRSVAVGLPICFQFLDRRSRRLPSAGGHGSAPSSPVLSRRGLSPRWGRRAHLRPGILVAGAKNVGGGRGVSAHFPEGRVAHDGREGERERRERQRPAEDGVDREEGGLTLVGRPGLGGARQPFLDEVAEAAKRVVDPRGEEEEERPLDGSGRRSLRQELPQVLELPLHRQAGEVCQQPLWS